VSLKRVSCPWSLLSGSRCFLTAMRWVASPSTCSCHYDILPCLRPKATESAEYGLKPLIPWAKINLSVF
jgi:hypothetical protein